MKIVVDFDQCDANGLCVNEAPDLFELTDDDMLIVKNENPAPEQREAAERAARACPKVAIELVD